MKNEEIKNLAISLAKTETENGVVQVLSKLNLWSNEGFWREIDASSGNWATIGNQQEAPDAALVEKIVNSVDAVLMRECLKEGIKPESENAPKSISEAQRKYFGIENGKLSNIDASIRSKIAENILLVATGKKGHETNPS